MTWSSASASHILVKDSLFAIRLKSKINNLEQFRENAKEYSICPSGKSGGFLRHFVPGEMVQEFDKVISEEPLHTIIGPIETFFGSHLIYIHTRM